VAARVGFDFEHPSQTATRSGKELARCARSADNTERREPCECAVAGDVEEVGDCCSRPPILRASSGVDAESALRAANVKFERRFRAMRACEIARLEFSS